MRWDDIVKEYCSDIVERSISQDEILADDSIFPFDEYLYDEARGGRIKALRDKGGVLVALEDVLTLGEEDFVHLYKDPASLECYRGYRSRFEFTYGMDLFMKVQAQLLKAREQAAAFEAKELVPLTTCDF